MSTPPLVNNVLRGIEERHQRAARKKAAPHLAPPAPQRPSGKICSAAELLAREFPALRWAIFSLLAEGLFLLAGRPKLGKSWLVLNFAVAIASGGFALGTIKVEAGDVLYCALEDGARRLQERLRRALGIGSVPDHLYLATDWRPFDRGGLEDLEDWIKGHPQARLIVFDTLERVRPSEDSRARLYHSDYQAVQGLQDLAKKYSVCILVVHHTRKLDASDHLDLVSGSTGLTGAADGVLILKRSRGDSDATLTANGRDFPDTELALKFDGELCDWRALGSAAEYRMSNERRDVIELLRKSDSLTPKTVAEILGREHGPTKKLLWTMAKDGEVHADSKGRYSLTNAGVPGNPVTAPVTVSEFDGNPRGNPKNIVNQGVFEKNNGRVTTVTKVTKEYQEPTKEEWSAAASDPEEWERLVTAAERHAIEHEESLA